MGLNDTPSANRIHIGFFGKRNAGKSSLVNAVTGQSLAVVSDVKGTTTDPVYKSMELLPLGPVMIIDTPGMDDSGGLGELRVKKARQVLNKTDIAVLVADAAEGLGDCERELIGLIKAKNVPYIVAYNKSDLFGGVRSLAQNEINVCALTGEGVRELKERMARMAKPSGDRLRILSDLIRPLDFVVLVIPIDKAAPKGRLILPQQQVIRDILDSGAMAVMTKENGLSRTLSELGGSCALVVTDSQIFESVARAVPDEIPLTSFSILMARFKGVLDGAVEGVAAIDGLGDADRVLISEGCTHHRQCEDIGTVKLPRMLLSRTGKRLSFEFTSGGEFPENLSPYSLVIHCGGCMLNEREMRYRMKCAADQGVPMTNYGMAIAHMRGVLKRSLSVFPKLKAVLD